MSTALDTDIESLVGEQEDQPCEHSQHTRSTNHRDEPASHYVRGGLGCACPVTDIYAGCPAFVAAIQSGVKNQCPACKVVAPMNEHFEIVAPIKGTQP